MPAARIFISYSHRGNGPQWKAALLHALQVFEHQHLLDVWEDGKIRVSRYWDDDIKAAMDNASIAVVLLTPDAIDPRNETDPNYILDTEFPALRQLQQEKRLIVFPVICEDCPWTRHDWLRATQAPNQSNPLADLSAEAQARVFRQLATAIAEALSQLALAESSRSETTPSDDHLYLDKFSLTRGPGLREEKLIGREQELALLDLAFTQPNTAIVSIVAWGGVGKTMLVQHWLQRLQREGWFGARRVYAWSFYSQGTQEDRQASEDMFLAHALEWFGVQCEPTLSPWDKGRLLANAVARERTLLILDGVEPLQYPPGPMGGQLRAPGVQSLLKHLARKARSGDLSLANCLCLVTTREPLADLADFQRREGSPWGSVLRVDLGNLTDEAGAALLHHAGANRAGAAEIKPGDKELLAASHEVDGHALTLNLLGRFLARAHAGDVRRRDLVKFEEADRAVQGGTTFKMLGAFDDWFAKSGEFGARQLAVLRMLGLFDRPADEFCINLLREPPVIAGLTDPLFTTRQDVSPNRAKVQPLLEEDWSNAASFLADFGLVVMQSNANDTEIQLDCHPLIREYFANYLRTHHFRAWCAGHRRLFESLNAISIPSRKPTAADLLPRYHAVTHGCHAKMYRGAFKSYLDRLANAGDIKTKSLSAHYSLQCLGAFSQELAAISNFFEVFWREPTPRLRFYDRSWAASFAGFVLRGLGRYDEAIDAMLKGQEFARKLRLFFLFKDWAALETAARNLSELRLLMGDICHAIKDAEEAVASGERVCFLFDQELSRESSRAALADALHQNGLIEDAKTLFQSAEQIHSNVASPGHLGGVRGFKYHDLMISKTEASGWKVVLGIFQSTTPNIDEHRDAIALLIKRSDECLQSVLRGSGSLLDIGLHYLTSSRAYLLSSLLLSDRDSHVEPHLKAAKSLEHLRKSGAQHHVPRALLIRAWAFSVAHDPSASKADLDEAWDIAERGPMRLHMADIHLYRARLFFREKAYPWESPQADLAAAEKLINEWGYHRRDEELTDAKHAILGI